MRIDKFGVCSLVIGLVLLFGMLHFVFMAPNGGWTVQNLITAVTVTVEGGLILLGIVLAIIGILLLVL
jgi:hypothetical protein